MVIKNRFIGNILIKIFRIHNYEVNFTFTKLVADKDITELAFLNKSLEEFDIKAKEFRDEIKKGIKEAQ